MPRAHRYFLPGYLWHITHRCHQKEFLLKFAKEIPGAVYLFPAKSASAGVGVGPVLQLDIL